MRWLVVVVVIAGCSGLSYDELVDQRIEAECSYLVRCGVVASLDDCRAHRARTQIDSPSAPAALDAGKLELDEDAADACRDAFETLSCDTTLQTKDDLAVCGDVIRGRVGRGARCGFDAECTTGYCERPACADACCLGTCEAQRVLPGPGESCTVFCDDTSYCGVDSICLSFVAEGGACNGLDLCGAHLYCAGIQNGSGVCTALPHLGESCDGPCAEVNAVCAGGTCVPVGLVGAPCESDTDCSAYYSCSDGTCGEHPALGATCTNRCAEGAFCEDGTCVPQKATGQPCTYNDECTSHACERELCYEPVVCI